MILNLENLNELMMYDTHIKNFLIANISQI